jgi:hypothetical protein
MGPRFRGDDVQMMSAPEQGSPRDAFPLAATILVFAAACAVLAWPWLSGRVTIPWDAKSQFLPQVRFLAHALANGDSPFWTPNVFAGWPQIADPQSLIFSPLHVLLAWLDAAPGFRAIDGVTFALLFLGGVGIILFFRDRGWHAAGALVAALAFAFGGSANARLQHTGQIISLVYFPLTLWLLARAFERGSLRAALAAGVLGGLTAIGRDQVALLALYLLAGYVVAHWLDGNPLARMRASLKPLAVIAVSGLLVAAIPIVMSLLLALDSNRPQFGFADAGAGSLHPAHLLTLWFADLYGANDPAVDFWGPPSLPWSEKFGWPGLYLAQNVGQLYAGTLVIVALALGLVRGTLWAREVRYVTIAAALMLLYALGWYTPAFYLMYELLPGVKLFRRPADATFLLGALLAILAGYVVHRWLTGTMPPLSRRQQVTAFAIALIGVGIATGLAIAVGVGGGAAGPIVIGVGLAIGATGALVLVCRLRRSLAAALVLAAFMTLDLAWNAGPSESTGLAPAMYDALRPNTANDTVALLEAKLDEAPGQRDRVELAGLGYHWPNLGLVHGFDHVFGHNPLRLKSFFEATQVGDTVATPDQRRFSPLFPSYRSPLADLLGLRLIATGVPVEQIDTSLPPGALTFLARTRDAYVYENPRALPRALFVTGWRVVDFAALIRDGGWPDVDFTRTVLLARAPDVSSNDGSGTARIIRYANTEVVVEVEAPAAGFLVLNDVWHPWWRASLDGKPAEILKANVLFRAVAVPAGRHMVRFTFHPFAGMVQEIVGKVRGGK